MASYFELVILLCILLLPVLYETSHVFRYYFKFSIYYGIVSFCSMMLVPVMLFRPCDCRNLLWASAICRHVSIILGLKWELRGEDHWSKERACIIVANHQSSLDVLGLFGIWHIMKKCTVVVKQEIFYVWPFGLAAWLSGIIFINRVQSNEARGTLNSATEKIKENRTKLLVFPEGTRRNTGEIHDFKKGAFYAAIESQLPIMPVVFSSYITFLNDKKRILDSGDIIITTLPPIPTTGLTKDDIPDLMEKIHKLMSDTHKITSEEILSRFKSSKVKSNSVTNLTENGKKDDVFDELKNKQKCLKDAVKAQ